MAKKKKQKKQIRYFDTKRPPIGVDCVFDFTEDRKLIVPFVNGKRCKVINNSQNTTGIKFYGDKKVYQVHPRFLLSYAKKVRVKI